MNDSNRKAKQLKLFHDNGDARYPNPMVTAAHVGAVAGTVPPNAPMSEFVVDTFKRSFATLEFILDTVSNIDQSKETRALKESILLNGVHALAQMRPVQFNVPKDIDSKEAQNQAINYNQLKILRDIGYYSDPLDETEKKSAEIDLQRPCREMPHGKERTNLISALSGAVVTASKEASFGKCVKKWSKLNPRDAAQFPSLMAYFDDVKRPAALEILRLRVEKASRLFNEKRLDERQVKTAIKKALQKFFEASPVESDKSTRTTHASLMELMENPHMTTITTLYDPMDRQRIKMTVNDHCRKFAKVYEQEMLEHLPLLDEALSEVDHPLHKMAESVYCARWGQVAEELQCKLGSKLRTFPPTFASDIERY